MLILLDIKKKHKLIYTSYITFKEFERVFKVVPGMGEVRTVLEKGTIDSRSILRLCSHVKIDFLKF